MGWARTGLGVGILTGEDRDKWAKARQELVSISATNARNLDVIDKALFVLCLDEVCTPLLIGPVAAHPNHMIGEPA